MYMSTKSTEALISDSFTQTVKDSDSKVVLTDLKALPTPETRQIQLMPQFAELLASSPTIKQEQPSIDDGTAILLKEGNTSSSHDLTFIHHSEKSAIRQADLSNNSVLTEPFAKRKISLSEDSRLATQNLSKKRTKVSTQHRAELTIVQLTGKEGMARVRARSSISKSKTSKKDMSMSTPPDTEIQDTPEQAPLSKKVLAKVKQFQHFIQHIDSTAGLSCRGIDENGIGNASRVRLPERELIAAMKMLAVDLELEHPDNVGRAQAEELAIFESRPYPLLPHALEWAIVDFNDAGDLEARAQALLRGRGFEGRSLLGIQCCMQAWQRQQLVEAGLPTLGFRPEPPEAEKLHPVWLSSWEEAQQQGWREYQTSQAHAALGTKSGAPSASSIRVFEHGRSVTHPNDAGGYGQSSQALQSRSGTSESARKGVCLSPPMFVI